VRKYSARTVLGPAPDRGPLWAGPEIIRTFKIVISEKIENIIKIHGNPGYKSPSTLQKKHVFRNNIHCFLLIKYHCKFFFNFKIIKLRYVVINIIIIVVLKPKSKSIQSKVLVTSNKSQLRLTHVSA
jgi:hypothetical protein